MPHGFDAGPADWLVPLPAEGAWHDVGSRITNAEWQAKYGPRVVFDSGWFDWRRGQPVPDLEAIRVAPCPEIR